MLLSIKSLLTFSLVASLTPPKFNAAALRAPHSARVSLAATAFYEFYWNLFLISHPTQPIYRYYMYFPVHMSTCIWVAIIHSLPLVGHCIHKFYPVRVTVHVKYTVHRFTVTCAKYSLSCSLFLYLSFLHI